MKDAVVAVPLMCCAADMLTSPSRKQVVLVGVKSSEEFENMVAAAHAAYDPNKTVSIFCGEKLNLDITFYNGGFCFLRVLILNR